MSRRQDRDRTRHNQQFVGLEPLEQRRLLSADFIGFQYELRNVPGSGFQEDYSVELRLIEGSIGQDNYITGALFNPGADGPELSDKKLPFGKLYRALDGRLERPDDDGDDDSDDDVIGAGLVDGDGAELGFTSKKGGGQLVRPGTVEFLMERATESTVDSYLGGWTYIVLGVSDEPGELMVASPEFVASGSLDISLVEVDDDGDEMTPPILVGQIDWGAGAAPELRRMVSTVSDGSGEDGLLETDEGGRFYLSAGGDAMVFADLATADGTIFVGIAVRPAETGENEEGEPLLTEDDVTGQYIVQNISTAKSNPNSGDVASAYGFVLRDDGTVLVQVNGGDDDDDSIDYTPEELAEAIENGDSVDMGGAKLATGTWELDGDTIRINVGGTITEYLVAKSEGLLVLKDPEAGRAFGLAIRTLPLEEWEEAIEAADGQVMEYDDEDGWRKSDPVAETGSPDVVGGLRVFVVNGEAEDEDDRALFATGVGEGGELLLFKQLANGHWEYINILDSVEGAEPIERDLRVLRTSDDRVLLAGLNADGDVVLFETTESDLLGDFETEPPAWMFTNVNDEYLSGGESESPEFAGEVFAFTTAWNTTAFAGLDGEGDLWVVWTTPDIDSWYANNLTEQFEHEGYAGDMGVSFTAWGGINITGTSLSGAVKVTWWVPSFGGAWVQSDLSAETGGPKIVTNSAFSVNGTSFGLAGLTEDGDLVIFSWSAEDQAWRVLAVAESDDLDDEIDQKQRGVQTVVTDDGVLRVLATTKNGAVIQFRPFESIAGGWMMDELG